MQGIENNQYDKLFARLYGIGAVIDFLPFALDGANGADGRIHRQAALATLHALNVRSDTYFDRLFALPDYASRRREDFFAFSIDEDALGDGERITVAEFLGRYCDLSGRRLLFRGRGKHHLNDLFWFGDEENPHNRVAFDGLSQADGGLAAAYVDPPYRLSGTLAEQNTVFFEAIDELFGGMRGQYTIYRWSDAASNYFDAGKEWWGTYFWTAHEHGTDRIVGIAASATD